MKPTCRALVLNYGLHLDRDFRPRLGGGDPDGRGGSNMHEDACKAANCWCCSDRGSVPYQLRRADRGSCPLEPGLFIGLGGIWSGRSLVATPPTLHPVQLRTALLGKKASPERIPSNFSLLCRLCPGYVYEGEREEAERAGSGCR